MEKKNLQKEMNERVLRIETPFELFRFVDEYFDLMTNEGKLELLRTTLGIRFLLIDDNDLESKRVLKFELADIFRNGFKKENGEVTVLYMSAAPMVANRWFLDPLVRKTTPEQIKYMQWLVNTFDVFKDNYGIDVEKIPYECKMYLLESGIKAW